MYMCKKYACRPTCADFGDRRTDGYNCIECKRHPSIYMNLDYVFDDIRPNCLHVYIEYSCLLFPRVNRYIFQISIISFSANPMSINRIALLDQIHPSVHAF